MSKIRKIIKKKKKNEAKEALAKASGGEELEIAAKILGELRERNKRKSILCIRVRKILEFNCKNCFSCFKR